VREKPHTQSTCFISGVAPRKGCGGAMQHQDTANHLWLMAERERRVPDSKGVRHSAARGRSKSPTEGWLQLSPRKYTPVCAHPRCSPAAAAAGRAPGAPSRPTPPPLLLCASSFSPFLAPLPGPRRGSRFGGSLEGVRVRPAPLTYRTLSCSRCFCVYFW